MILISIELRLRLKNDEFGMRWGFVAGSSKAPAPTTAERVAHFITKFPLGTKIPNFIQNPIIFKTAHHV